MLLLLPFQLVLLSQGTFPRGSWGLLKVARGTSEASCTPSCLKGLFAACVSPSARISKPPSSWHLSTTLRPGCAVLRPPTTSGQSSLHSPARTEVRQVALAPKMPEQSWRWLGVVESAGSGRRARCWVGNKGSVGRSWSFQSFKHSSGPKPPPDKRLAM